MQKALIKINYRQVIDISAQTEFEKYVYFASYKEFLLKSQSYNPEGKFKTFTEMKAADGRANSLHYKCSFAVDHLIKALGNKTPGLLDTLEQPVSFATYRFELIESNIADKTAHKIAVNYISDTLLLLHIIGDCLLLTTADKINTITTEAAETFMIRMKEGLSVVSYQVVSGSGEK